MKVLPLNIILILTVLTSYKNFELSQCSRTERWFSQGYEDAKTGLTMYLPSVIEFKPDTITIKNANPKLSKQRVNYLILNKKCDWDKAGLSGFAEYRIRMVSNKNTATLILKATDGKGTLIIQMDDNSVYSPKLDVTKLIDKR
jgi:hypothetical protein